MQVQRRNLAVLKSVLFNRYFDIDSSTFSLHSSFWYFTHFVTPDTVLHCSRQVGFGAALRACCISHFRPLLFYPTTIRAWTNGAWFEPSLLALSNKRFPRPWLRRILDRIAVVPQESEFRNNNRERRNRSRLIEATPRPSPHVVACSGTGQYHSQSEPRL